MPSILFVKTSSLGDVIHHMPAVADVRIHHPDAHISWIVEEAYVPLVGLHPEVNEIIPVATRRWRRHLGEAQTWREMRAFRASISRRRFDAIIDTQGLIRTAIMTRLAGGPRHGYDRASIREPLAARFYDVRHSIDHNLHAIDRNRLLTGHALGYTPFGPADYGLETPREILGKSYAMFFHASARVEKQWPVDRWVDLGRSLAGLGLQLVLPWGTAQERAQSEQIAKELPTAFIPERRSLDHLSPVIRNAILVVGVDTGLLHLAAALRTPLVGIFTNTKPALTSPRGEGPITVLGGPGQQPEVAEVFAAAREIIAQH